MTRQDLVSLLGLILRDPRAGFRAVRRLRLTGGERLALVCLVAVLNVLAATSFLSGLPEVPDTGLAEMVRLPLVFAGLQLASLGLMALLVHQVGRLFGGRGDRAGAVEVVILLQIILLLFQVAQVVSLILLPPMVTVLGLASIVAALWYMTQFLTELHGFSSARLTFLGLIASFLALVLALSLILAVTLGPEALNV